MSVEEIALELVSLCRNQKFTEAQEKFYAEDVISIEPHIAEKTDQIHSELKGKEEVKKKRNKLHQLYEIHKLEISEPMVAGDFFTVKFYTESTHRMTGRKERNSEIALYFVQEGKIIQEQFFYNAARPN